LRFRDVFGLGAANTELHRRIAVGLIRAHRDDLAVVDLQQGYRDVGPFIGEDARHTQLPGDETGAHLPHPYSLISTSTPAARSSFISASTVCGVGSTMSSTRLWVQISNCSRDFLSTCGDRSTVNFSILVGSGIGPRTRAPVRFAVLTISLLDWSSTRWSYALRRIRMFWLSAMLPLPGDVLWLFQDLGDDAGADRAAALADREAQPLVHRDRHEERHLHRHIVARHHHLGALGQLDGAGDVGGAEVELRPVIVEERRVP